MFRMSSKSRARGQVSYDAFILKLDRLPSCLAPPDDASLEPGQGKIREENDCDENDDPGKKRRRVVGLRRIEDEVAEAFV